MKMRMGTPLLLLVAAFATAPSAAGNPQLIEAPPPYGSCTSPITSVLSQTNTSQGSNLTVMNNSGTTANDALIIQAVVDGTQRLVWVPISLRSGQGAAIGVVFTKTVDSPIVILCGNHPIGVVDPPDPFVTVTVQ